jgi:hypothetical protein
MRRLILRRAVAFVATLFVVPSWSSRWSASRPVTRALIMGTEASRRPPRPSAARWGSTGRSWSSINECPAARSRAISRSIQYDVGVARLVVSRPAVTLLLTVLAALSCS